MYRKEYPRPQFVRKEWLCLNGKWQFDFDDNNIGLKQNWLSNSFQLTKTIEVPFAYQCELSGIHDRSVHDTIWYKKSFHIPSNWEKKRVLLHFGAVDYFCKVYINETYVGSHEGGHTAFSFDISDYLSKNENVLTVYVEDYSFDETIPRGKQTWLEKPTSIWYTRTSGIWQSVWLEPVDACFIKQVFMKSDLTKMSESFDFIVSNECIGKDLEMKISYDGLILALDRFRIFEKEFEKEIYLFKNKVFRHGVHGANQGWMWSPEAPHLFDVEFRILDESSVYDEVSSYFGMRSIATKDGMILLNNKPYYQRLVLNQGYWREGLLSAPKDEDFIKDIELMKAMGFNGCRIHQKVEDPRFLYWADKLGFIVWGECAAFPTYHIEANRRLHQEWYEIIQRDFNHPCIVTWTPLNESWGVEDIAFNSQQQAFALSLYYRIKSMDPTRLVVSNDGWEAVTSDIIGVHNYRHGLDDEIRKYEDFKKDLKNTEGLLSSIAGGHQMMAIGYSHHGEPIMLTEFGGIAYDVTDKEGWGYTSVQSEADFINTYARVMDAIYASETICGFCYTQLSDVEQEMNGLLTFDHQPKLENINKIKEINEQWHSKTIK